MLLLHLSILNVPGEAAVQDQKVGGEGVTYNALLREGRPRIGDHEPHRSAQKQYFIE